MSSKLESDVCCHLQVAPSGKSYEVKRRPGRKQWQTTAIGIWRDSLHVTCGLTACKPGSAPGPTLGNKYGKTLPLVYMHWKHNILTRYFRYNKIIKHKSGWIQLAVSYITKTINLKGVIVNTKIPWNHVQCGEWRDCCIIKISEGTRKNCTAIACCT